MASKHSSQPFPVKERDILHSNTTRYLVVNFNGEGCFGKVAECLDLIKGTMAAVKIHKKSRSRSIRKEVEMLEAIRSIDPDKNNIVKFMEHFRFNNLSCLAFEMLDKSLWDLMKERNWKGLSPNQIRPVTNQLLVAFKALRNKGIMHTDLKPDNIMLVNHQNQPFKIKLIDFGLALPVNQAEVGMLMQASAYRAPEVTLGLPLSESVDMWGVGCVMAFLYFGVNLFPGNCAYHCMKLMLQLLGEPDDRLLDIGQYSKFYFTTAGNSRWRLRTPEEYAEVTGEKPSTDRWYFDCDETLEDIIRSYSRKKSDFEFRDRMALADLMVSCLHPNYDDRITPKEALKHEFVTMAHLVDPQGSDTYLDPALKFMALTHHSYEDEQNCEESSFSSLSLSPGEVQITESENDCSYEEFNHSSLSHSVMEGPSTDSDSSFGIEASPDKDSKEPDNEEQCAPMKCGCGQTYTRSENENEGYPDHLDESEEDCSYEQSGHSSLSHSIMESPSTDSDRSFRIEASLDKDGKETEMEEQCAPVKCGCGQTYTRSENEKEGYPENLDQSEDDCSDEVSNCSSLSHSAVELQILESSSTDTDSSFGIKASQDEDGKESENEEQCAPMKCGCGQTYTRSENEKEGYPEHLDESEDDCSYEESNRSSLSHSAVELQILESSSTDTDSSFGIKASLDEDGKEPENEEQCAPMKCGCGQPYTSNHASCPSSPGNNDTSSDIVPNEEATASISSNHGHTTSLPAPVGSEEPDHIETGPVPARRKTIRQRIGRFVRRVRKLLFM